MRQQRSQYQHHYPEISDDEGSEGFHGSRLNLEDVAEIVQLLASPVHRFGGRPADGPAPAPQGELVERVEIRKDMGIVGDRYFGKQAHIDAAITIIAAEALPPGADLTHVRRNILIRGVAIDDLVGATIALDSGDGPVRLRINRRANPCAWMDATIAPGAWRALKGKGGVRCTPLSDGVLRVGPVEVSVEERQIEPS